MGNTSGLWSKLILDFSDGFRFSFQFVGILTLNAVNGLRLASATRTTFGCKLRVANLAKRAMVILCQSLKAASMFMSIVPCGQRTNSVNLTQGEHSLAKT